MLAGIRPHQPSGDTRRRPVLIAGKGGADWGYAMIPVAGPAVGAVAPTMQLLGI